MTKEINEEFAKHMVELMSTEPHPYQLPVAIIRVYNQQLMKVLSQQFAEMLGTCMGDFEKTIQKVFDDMQY